MTFLTPAFLLGALALAIPVVIHLTNREKRELVEFPSLMFLRKIPYRSVRRQKLRHLLLFALRCLALVLLALAFARPFFESPPAAAATSLGPREIVLLIDHSYSMDYEDRLERAKEEARSFVDSLGLDERASIIVFSDRAEILSQPTSDHDQLRAMIDGIEISSRTTRYAPALKLAKKVVDESNLRRKEVVLISDFQSLGWEGDEDAWLPAGTQLTPVNLGSAQTQNLSVTGVILERDSLSGRERLQASARVTYKAAAEAPPAETRIHLELDQRSLQTKPVALEPNSSETISFDPVTLPAGMSRGTVRIEADSLEMDNAYHFVLWPGQSLSVLSLEGRGASDRRSFYLHRALSLGDRPSFRIDRKPMDQLREDDFDGRDVVLLNDVSSVSESAAELLEEFVGRGGGLLVVLGEESGRNSFSGPAARLLPAPPGPPVDRARDWGGTLSYLDYGSPIFEIFSAPHSGDFSTAKFFRYRAFDQPVTEGVLARFDDGAVALAEKRVSDGRVLVWTSTLDTFWNDLARQPVYLPFVHQLVKYAAGYAEANPWHTVGQVADLSSYFEMVLEGEAEVGDNEQYDLVVSTPSSEKRIIAVGDERALLTLEEHGFYELRQAGRGARIEPVSLASNLDSVESDLATLDPEELVAAVTFRETTTAGSGVPGDNPSEQEGRQAYWWYLLIGALGLLASETILSNRLSRASTQ